MTLPTYTFGIPSDADLAADKPLAQAKVLQLWRSLHHVRQTLYDDTHVPAALHDHDGINSARILLPGPNLVEQASLNDETAGAGGTRWVASGATFGNNTGDAGAHMQTTGQYIYEPLGPATMDVEDCLGSNGATFNVSIFVKSAGAQTAGSMVFGLTDAAAPPTWITGCSATVRFDRLTTTFQRFHFTCNPGNTTGIPRFGAYVGASFTNEIRVDCVQVTPGSQLAPWHPMPNDPAHYNYGNISQNVPCWDHAIAHVNATRLTGA